MKKHVLTNDQIAFIKKQISAIPKNFNGAKVLYSIKMKGNNALFRLGLKITTNVKQVLKDPYWKIGKYIYETIEIGPRGGIVDRRGGGCYETFPRFQDQIFIKNTKDRKNKYLIAGIKHERRTKTTRSVPSENARMLKNTVDFINFI